MAPKKAQKRRAERTGKAANCRHFANAQARAIAYARAAHTRPEFFCPKTHCARGKYVDINENTSSLFFKVKKTKCFCKKMKKTAPEKIAKAAPETPAKNRHGGARPGAGRKKGDGGRIAADIKNPLNINFSFSLSKKHLKKLKDFAKKNKLSASKVLQNFIENL